MRAGRCEPIGAALSAIAIDIQPVTERFRAIGEQLSYCRRTIELASKNGVHSGKQSHCDRRSEAKHAMRTAVTSDAGPLARRQARTGNEAVVSKPCAGARGREAVVIVELAESKEG